MAQIRGRCIFCGGVGLSKEHLFSDWLRELFPRDANDTHTVGERDTGRWRLATQQGHSGSKKFRTVCERCNTGWMNHIDDDARAVAATLIQGNRTRVTPEMQVVLARWFAKIAVVGDSRKSKKSVIPQTQRTHLMDRKEPPPEWEIWMASYGGQDWRELGLFQYGGRLDFTPVRGPGTEFTGYAETTFVGMGALCALIIADDLPMVDFNVGLFRDIAQRIWPLGSEFGWPLRHPLNDAEAEAAARILESMRANFR